MPTANGSGERGAKIRLEFSVEETNILRAVYNSRVTSDKRSSRPTKVEFTPPATEWAEETPIWFTLDEPKPLVDDLIAYHEATDTVVRKLSGEQATQDEKVRRIALGERVLHLAAEVGIEAATWELRQEMEQKWFKSYLHPTT